MRRQGSEDGLSVKLKKDNSMIVTNTTGSLERENIEVSDLKVSS